MVLEKTLESPLDSKETQQSILEEISPEQSLEGLMLKLKLQYFATWFEELTRWKRPWCWERLKAGGEGDDRGWDGWMASRTQWTWVWVNSGSWWWTGRPGLFQSMGWQRVGHNWVTELNSTELKWKLLSPWDFPSKNTGMGCHALLQGIFSIQGSNPGLLHCRYILYHLSHQGSF